MTSIFLGVYPNHYNYKKKDPKFTAIFYNLMPVNIDLYGVDFEGRRHQITKELEKGFRRKEITTASIPWVFKRSDDEERLPIYVESSMSWSFKGENFGARAGSTIHVTVNENGMYI